MTFAVFDLNKHAIQPGWATYHEDVSAHPHIDAPPPQPPNGHSPSNYAKCACGVALKWYVVGQHRYGSLDASHSDWREPRVTHGRHCPCSACARQDWTDPTLAHCGMHGPACPLVYDPVPSE